MEREARSIVVRALSALVVAACSWLIPALSQAQTTRPYQMTLLGSVDAHIDVNPPSVISYNAGVDIPTFYYGREATPASGPMIVWLAPTNDSVSNAALDWSRVVAVYVDEPYLLSDGETVACSSAMAQQMTSTLQTMAAAVRSRAPKARFWVNYNWHEVEAMRNHGCVLNHAFIDVVSVDRYDRPFNNVILSYYDYLYANRPVPHQQLALIPGTHKSNDQSDYDGAVRLPEFFAYAHAQNQTCDLPLGPIGATGSYDGCRVWIIAGFIGGASRYEDSNGFKLYPIEHQESQLIRAVWEETFAKPRYPRPPPDVSWVPAVLKLLLD